MIPLPGVRSLSIVVKLGVSFNRWASSDVIMKFCFTFINSIAWAFLW